MIGLVSWLLVVLGAYGTVMGLALTGFALVWCLWTVLFGVRGAEWYMEREDRRRRW